MKTWAWAEPSQILDTQTVNKWVLRGLFLGTVVLVACGQEPSARGEPVPPGIGELRTLSMSAAEEEGPTLPPAACIPFEGTQLAEERACQVSGYDAQGSLAYTRRLDAQGNVLEERSFAPDGTLNWLITSRWKDGHEVFRRWENTAGAWTETTTRFKGDHPVFRRETQSNGSWTQTVQHWDAEGREIFRRTSTSAGLWSEMTQRWHGQQERFWRTADSSGYWAERQWTLRPTGQPERKVERGSQSPEVVSLYFYSADGRLERIEDSRGGITVYTYDAQGRVSLVDINSGDTLWRYAYHPNGQLSRESREADSWNMAWEYDPEGRTTYYAWCQHVGCTSTRSTYNPEGLLVHEQSSSDWSNRFTTSLRTFQYDDEGRLTVRWHLTQSEDSHTPIPVSTRSALTDRMTYLCGSDRLMLEEQDLDEDGVVDGQHRYERDAQGRRVREQFSGSLQQPGQAVRIEYQYECQ